MPSLDPLPQVVFVSIWGGKIWTFEGEKRIEFNRIPEARAWANERGKGIKIRFPNQVKK